MGKIRDYAQVALAKLTDLFVIDRYDSGVHTTNSVTVEQIGDAVCGEQAHATLNTSDKTIIGSINEVNGKTAGDIPLGSDFSDPTSTAGVIGDLSTLTTTDKSSIVGAVNSIYPTKDIGGTAKGVNATYQIPAGVLAHSIITIALRRYAYAGEVTILSENITAGAYTNGLTVFGAHDKYAEFSISTTGLITVTAISNWAEVYIDLIGIF